MFKKKTATTTTVEDAPTDPNWVAEGQRWRSKGGFVVVAVIPGAQNGYGFRDDPRYVVRRDDGTHAILFAGDIRAHYALEAHAPCDGCKR